MSVEIKEGAVHKDGVVIASYNPDTKTVTSSKPLFPAHKAQINSAIGEKVTFVVDDGSAPDASPNASQQAGTAQFHEQTVDVGGQTVDFHDVKVDVGTPSSTEAGLLAPPVPEAPKQKSMLEIAREQEAKEEAEEKARLAKEEEERIEREKQRASTPPEEIRRIDPEPAMDPAAGDKTPSYVAWYRRNHTEAEFNSKYGHRNFAGKE